MPPRVVTTPKSEATPTPKPTTLETTTQNTGYNYPVPDNPLTLPPRVVTTPKTEPTPTTPQPTTPKPEGKFQK